MHSTKMSMQELLVSLAVACLAIISSVPTFVHAQGNIVPTCGAGDPCYSGGGIEQGVNDVSGGIGGIQGGDPRATIISIVKNVVSFLGLAAVVVIVIAGIYLIFSNGNDEAKEKAKKIIFYVVAGMLLIIFASAIVTLVASFSNPSS